MNDELSYENEDIFLYFLQKNDSQELNDQLFDDFSIGLDNEPQMCIEPDHLNLEHLDSNKKQQDIFQPILNDEHQVQSDQRTPKQVEKSLGKKKKTYYKSKLAQLIQQPHMKDHKISIWKGKKKQHSQQSDNLQLFSKNIDSRQDQLKKNRESAKRSRQMRNQYVEQLQIKIKEQQDKINELTLRLRQAELERDRLKQSKHPNVLSFYQNTTGCYDKLAEMLEKINLNEQSTDQLDACIDSMQKKYGSAGKQRINLVNYHMSQIIENLFVDFQKYMINSALTKSGVFGMVNQDYSQRDVTLIDFQLSVIMGCKSQQKMRDLVVYYDTSFAKQVQTFSQMCQQFYKSFTLLINQVNILQNIFMDMKKGFLPEQIAKLVLYFEHNKYRKDVRKIKNEWYDNFKRNEENMIKEINKMNKKNKFQ